MRVWVLVLGVLAAFTAGTAGCGGRCTEIAARKRALVDRTGAAPGPHVRVHIPMARANQLLATLIHDQPLQTSIDLPDLSPLPKLPIHLSARVSEITLRPGPADRLRFAVELEVNEREWVITTLAVVVDVVPTVTRTTAASELYAGFGPENLLSIKPQLGTGGGHRILDAIKRWVPATVLTHLPRELLDRAVAKLVDHLTGKTYDLLRDTLYRELGDLTRLRIQLPALPIATTTVTSSDDAITVDITTDLPVRRGLAPDLRPPDALAGDDAVVLISPSTVAEITNWSITSGHLPQHYTRDLDPKPDGEYRPWFDYLADDHNRPVKLHIFQEHGGCSYFQLGLRYQIVINDDKLEVDVHDRYVESAIASAPLEVGLWLQQLIEGSVESTYRAAAHTQLGIGSEAFEARLVRTAVTDDAIGFALQLVPAPPPVMPPPLVGLTRPDARAARPAAMLDRPVQNRTVIRRDRCRALDTIR